MNLKFYFIDLNLKHQKITFPLFTELVYHTTLSLYNNIVPVSK